MYMYKFSIKTYAVYSVLLEKKGNDQIVKQIIHVLLSMKIKNGVIVENFLTIMKVETK